MTEDMKNKKTFMKILESDDASLPVGSMVEVVVGSKGVKIVSGPVPFPEDGKTPVTK
jgi:hypothetical protein